MNMISVKNVALGLALTATVFSAKAQKVYTEGMITYHVVAGPVDADVQTYFKPDTSSLNMQRGPAAIKMVSGKSGDYFVVLVDVPVAGMKKAAIATPAEIDEAQSAEPQYAFTKTDETKKIGDYNCKKYVAKDPRDGATYDVWITNDITVPPNILTNLYKSLAGTPVMFTYLQGGSAKGAQQVTLKSISDAKVPANMFKVTPDYDKMSMTDMQNMGKGH